MLKRCYPLPNLILEVTCTPLDTGHLAVSYITEQVNKWDMATQTISRDTPLSEIVLRKYEKPNGISGRELVRKLCLSTGLLQPGDSRDVIVDIFHALLEARGPKRELTSEEIQEIVIKNRTATNMPIVGIAPSNIRRQLKRLRDLFLIEKIKNRYRVAEFDSLNSIFEQKIEQYLMQSIVGRVKEYFKTVDERFG